MMLWHPDTDPPEGAENALIAAQDEAGDRFLVGFAEAHLGMWVSEESGVPYEAPFWWADERELLGMIDRGEQQNSERRARDES